MATRPTFDLIDGRFYSGDLGNVRDAYAWMRDHERVPRRRQRNHRGRELRRRRRSRAGSRTVLHAGGIRPETVHCRR